MTELGFDQAFGNELRLLLLLCGDSISTEDKQ